VEGFHFGKVRHLLHVRLAGSAVAPGTDTASVGAQQGVTPLRRLSIALSAVASFLVIPSKALAWGSEGHRIIAHLAFERLTPSAKAQIAVLIAHSADQLTPSCPVASLEDAATWPDCIRPLHGRFEYLAADHYEDVPICGSAPKASYCPDGKCIVDETARAEVIMKDPKRPPLDRLQALEEISHFIGDMHQPLHAADNHDRGGNDVRVQIQGHPSNLHHVWDTEALENAVGADEASAEAALRPLVARVAATASRGGLDDWLAETHVIAVTYVYRKLAQPPACGAPAPSQAISQAYLDGAAPIIRTQLARASVRLAVVLNQLLN